MQTRSRGFWHELALSWRALFDARTPGIAKILIVFGLLYGISPLDLLPDVFPFIGQLDDIGVIVAVILAFLRMSRKVRDSLRKREAVETTARVS